MRLGQPTSPIVFDAARLTGSFVERRPRRQVSPARRATIGKVPLLLSDGIGKLELSATSDLTVDSALTVSDRDPNPRFYPLRSNDVHFTLAGDYVRATGSLHHPGDRDTGHRRQHRASAVDRRRPCDCSTCPALPFGPNLQPEQLTRLTEGVVALVNGTVRGQGRIDWASGGKVTSTGDFSTANMDLAAPFGPVDRPDHQHPLHRSARTSRPRRTRSRRSRRSTPGITVENGVIHYQLLPHNRVKIERGEWPFMGGQLILEETVLDFGSQRQAADLRACRASTPSSSSTASASRVRADRHVRRRAADDLRRERRADRRRPADLARAGRRAQIYRDASPRRLAPGTRLRPAQRHPLSGR